MGVAGEAHVGGLGQGPLEDVARVGGRWLTVGSEDVAEHPGRLLCLSAPRQDLEGGRVRLGEHVGLEHAGQAFDGGAVKAKAFFEGTLNFGRRQRHRLQRNPRRR